MPVPPEENSRAGRRIAIICAIVAVLIVAIYAGNIVSQSREMDTIHDTSGGSRT